MKRLEHSDIIDAVKLAMQQTADDPETREFGKDDIARRVLAAHPEIDRARLDRVIDVVWKETDRYAFDEAQDNADWKEAQRHAETMPVREGLAYIEEYLHEQGRKLDKMAAHIYLEKVEHRVFLNHGLTGETTVGEVMRALGVEGFVAAVKAEFEADGHVECVAITVDASVRRYALESVLDYFRRKAEMILGIRPWAPLFPEVSR